MGVIIGKVSGESEDINPIGVMDSYCESQEVENIGQLFTMKSSARELL